MSFLQIINDLRVSFLKFLLSFLLMTKESMNKEKKKKRNGKNQKNSGERKKVKEKNRRRAR